MQFPTKNGLHSNNIQHVVVVVLPLLLVSNTNVMQLRNIDCIIKQHRPRRNKTERRDQIERRGTM